MNRRNFLGTLVLASYLRDSIACSLLSNTYTNPVFEPILADPTVIKAKNGWFYAYGTQDNWGDGKGSRLTPILKSKNLTHWEVVGNAFTEKPNWKQAGGLWAPDIAYVNNKYHLYYAYSTWGDPNPGIGVATSDNPEGPFTDFGKIFDSKDVNVPNSIDPLYYQVKSNKFLFWGSFSNDPTAGTYGILLDESGLQLNETSKPFKIAAGDFEAVMLHYRKGYYYFIGSKGSCCEGAISTYRLLVGRSNKLEGPYLDNNGNDLKEIGAGSLLLQGNEKFVGPGHCTSIITDKNNQDWILYHAILRDQPKVKTGANRRTLCLDRVHWENGWPKIMTDSPSLSPQESPFF